MISNHQLDIQSQPLLKYLSTAYMDFPLNSANLPLFQLCLVQKNRVEDMYEANRNSHSFFSVTQPFNMKTIIKQIFQTLFPLQEIILLTWSNQLM